jgi:hypothetical protein
MQHLEGSGTPVLYIGRTVLKGKKRNGTHHLSFTDMIKFFRPNSRLLMDGFQFQADSKW